MRNRMIRGLMLGMTLLCEVARAGLLDESPVGWASTSGGVTGGQGGTVQEVSTLADLQRLAKEPGKQVLLVRGRLGDGRSRVEITSDKTVFGLPGAVLAGGLDIKSGTANVIVRNLKVEGPGAVDVNGVDGVTVQGGERIWLDHLDISDGEDGNMDITNGADLVTVSWCKFSYTSKSQNHQFSNLIGSSDTRTADRGKLRVTLHHNWWTDGVKERMPRVRFGQVHVANNLFTSSVASHCVRAGIEADLLVEGNAFIGVQKPIDLFENNFKAMTVRDNIFTNVSGNTAGQGISFQSPYALALDAARDVESKVKGEAQGSHGAGATLPDPQLPTALAPTREGGRAVRAGLWHGSGMHLTPEMLLGRQYRAPVR
ncbi:MAG TPA: polysaccharide lyase family 1 protein [Fibrobacteria bacterium]|nr:polysaccharide lyase family 1 protein [Fibrobacteria bacterium]